MIDEGLYVGRVMHHRLRPKRHRFIYRVFTLLLDVDRLDVTAKKLRLLSFGKANLFSFHNKDHGQRNGDSLRPWVEQELRRNDISTPAAYIRLLAMPRFLGYVFNPLSIYYCYDKDKRLFSIIYEVKNTFGGQHSYVLPMPKEGTKSGRFHHGCNKDFYVSPFIESHGNYRFSLNNPNEDLDVRITEYVEDRPLLVATLQGKRKPLTDGQLVLQALKHPFLQQQVTGLIHFEALRLWLKGISLQPQHQQTKQQGR
jgi:DUF1365 family protein